MNGEKRMEEDIIQRKKNLIMFPLGTIGRDMVYNLVTSYLLTYVLFTRALTAAQLAAISAIMVGARVFDALNDPIMGNIIERTRTRWGKFKPWLVIGIVTTSVVVYLFFNTKLQGWSFVWFFGVMYFMYSITYTMHDISYWGMVPALSSDANARNQFTSRATLFAGIGGALAGMLIPIFTTGKNAIGGSTATASGAPSSFFIVSSTVYVTLLSSLSPEAGGQISQKIRDFVVIIHKSRLIVKSRAAGGGFRRIPPVQIAQELARRGRNMRPAGQHAHSQCPDSRAKMPAGCTAASAWPRSKTCRCGCAPTAGRAVSGLTPAIS